MARDRKIEVYHPKSREDWLRARSPHVNSSEVAALFGLSPYTSPFQMYHRFVGNLLIEDEPSEAITWGLRLERPIAEGIAEDRGWNIRKKNEYRFCAAERAGSSYDFQILKPNDAVFEIKNVFGLRFKDDWTKDEEGNLEAPPHMESQFQVEMDFAGKERLFCGALISGNQAVVIERERDEEVIQTIRGAVRAFWARVDARKPPTPDYRDVDAIRELYKDPDASIYDARTDAHLHALAKEHRKYLQDEKRATEMKRTMQAQIMDIIGNHCVKAEADEFTISCGMVKESVVQAHVRAARRDFRVNWKRST